jgi:hypothetical protein
MAMREKDRKLRRRQRRQAKLRKLKDKLAETNSVTERRKIMDKIQRVAPWLEPSEL